MEANRNFANKLWNAGRYILGNLKAASEEERTVLSQGGPLSPEEMKALSLPERYIIALCHDLVDKVTEGLETYDLVRKAEEERGGKGTKEAGQRGHDAWDCRPLLSRVMRAR